TGGPAHPRARGEHTESEKRAARTAGSSPRSRGTRALGLRVRAHERLIPALAGNTPGRGKHYHALSAHPRARGEHSGVAVKPSTFGGSSPRSRGTRRRVGLPGAVLRLIPALAGNTA